MVGRETERTDDEVGRLILIGPVDMSTTYGHLEVVSNLIVNVKVDHGMAKS
jgi:hypothetical protein